MSTEVHYDSGGLFPQLAGWWVEFPDDPTRKDEGPYDTKAEGEEAARLIAAREAEKP